MPDVDALIGKLRVGDYYSRSTAARALGEIGGEKATAALIDALHDEDDWVKEYAAEALGKLACEQAVEALGELLNSSNYKVQSAAAEALGKIGGDEARKLLEPLKKDDDTWVREAVLNALANISDERPPAESETPARASEPAHGVEYEDEPPLTMSEAPAAPEQRPPSPARMLADRTPRTPEEIVELIAKSASIKYKVTSSGFLLRVSVGGGRHQKVRLKFDSTDEEGSPIIQIFTLIAPAQPKHYHWALKLNPAFSYGAIGIVKIDGKEFLAITNTLLEENVDPKALEKSVRALAKRGDALEKKLLRKDSW